MHLSLPFIFAAAFGQQNNIVNAFAGWDCARDDEDAGHGLASGNALVRTANHCFGVMSEQNALFARRPFENRLVIGASQFGLLHRDDIQFRSRRRMPRIMRWLKFSSAASVIILGVS
jgi:hypothetical protein